MAGSTHQTATSHRTRFHAEPTGTRQPRLRWVGPPNMGTQPPQVPVQSTSPPTSLMPISIDPVSLRSSRTAYRSRRVACIPPPGPPPRNQVGHSCRDGQCYSQQPQPASTAAGPACESPQRLRFFLGLHQRRWVAKHLPIGPICLR